MFAKNIYEVLYKLLVHFSTHCQHEFVKNSSVQTRMLLFLKSTRKGLDQDPIWKPWLFALNSQTTSLQFYLKMCLYGCVCLHARGAYRLFEKSKNIYACRKRWLKTLNETSATQQKIFARTTFALHLLSWFARFSWLYQTIHICWRSKNFLVQ